MSPTVSLIVLILLIAVFGVGALYAGRSYGKIALLAVTGVGVVFIYGLYALGSISFIK